MRTISRRSLAADDAPADQANFMKYAGIVGWTFVQPAVPRRYRAGGSDSSKTFKASDRLITPRDHSTANRLTRRARGSPPRARSTAQQSLRRSNDILTLWMDTGAVRRQLGSTQKAVLRVLGRSPCAPRQSVAVDRGVRVVDRINDSDPLNPLETRGPHDRADSPAQKGRSSSSSGGPSHTGGPSRGPSSASGAAGGALRRGAEGG